MTGFKERFHLKQYMPRKPTKCSIKVWSLTNNSNGYVISVRSVEQETDQSVSVGGTSTTASDRILDRKTIMSIWIIFVLQ